MSAAGGAYFSGFADLGNVTTQTSQYGATSRSKVGRVTVRLDDDEVKTILRHFSKMGKQANDDLKDLSRSIARELVTEFQMAARGTRWYPEQASFVAQTARVSRDRVPSVTLGGAKQYSTSDGRRISPGSLLFLSEFGSFPSRQRRRFRNRKQQEAGVRGGLQGPPRSAKEGKGNRGWWLFPRLKRLQPDILRAWLEGAQEVADTWGKP